MHARVTTVEVKPDQWDALAEDRGVGAQLEKQQGFRGFCFLQNLETGKAVNITLWETEEDMRETEASGWYQEALQTWEDTYAAPPVTEHYEVGAAEAV